MDKNPGKLLYDEIKLFGGEINEDAISWADTMMPAMTRWLGQEGCDLVLGDVEMRLIEKKLKDVALTWARSWWMRSRPKVKKILIKVEPGTERPAPTPKKKDEKERR